ncbi:MAG: hypothetical protein A4E19_03380 [Nitrospira sp. SG-bin1]|nr:MAG: hypothetical protein A4E19_03380 [Nitrospira sp. SG-bin1]
MAVRSAILTAGLSTFLVACGSLEKKAMLLNLGDTREQVLAAMGPPDDRQLRGEDEAWQYCQTGAGFGYHDYRTVWFYRGKVTGINSYKSSRPASSCVTDLKPIKWEDAPEATIEIRKR